MGFSFYILPVLIGVLAVSLVALITSLFNYRVIRKFMKGYEEDLLNYNKTVRDYDDAFEAEQEEEVLDEEEDEKDQIREEVKLEIDRDMERLSSELRKNELLMEKMEKHYSTLRKVSKDMMESIIPPSKFQSFSDTYTPIPLIGEKPLWNDLAKNHIPSDQGDLYELWEKYVSLTGEYSHQKMEAIRGIQDRVFGSTEYRRSDAAENANNKESFYYAKPILQILNNLFFDMPEVDFKYEDGKKEKKIGRVSSLLVGNEDFIHGKMSELMAFESLFKEILQEKNFSICKETLKLKELKDEIEAMIKSIRKLLNWFIFEEDNMVQCKMLE